MTNVISKKLPVLTLQAQDALAGVTAHSAALALAIKPDALSLHITNLIAGVDTHVASKIDLREKRTVEQSVVEACIQFGTVARNVITAYLGTTPSEQLEGAGFKTLRIPRNVAGLLVMLRGVKKYFTDNPDHQVLGLNVSEARATTLIADLSTARNNVTAQKATVRTALNTRNAGAKVVRTDMVLLIKDLTSKLDPLSETWEAFKFKRPGLLEKPEMPENLVVILTGPTAAALKWDQAVRATGYRIYKKVVGVDEEFVLVDTRTDLDYTIEGLPAGATILISVAATNNGGDSAMTEPFTLVTPAV